MRGKGFTLVEVVVAMLVMATAAFGIMGVLLSARKTQASSDRRQVANFYAQLLRETLKEYVIAYPSSGTPVSGDLTTLRTTINGSWFCPSSNTTCEKLPGDGCSWALDASCNPHTADSLLPAWFSGASGSIYNGHMTYTVTAGADGGKSVVINVTWTEPST